MEIIDVLFPSVFFGFTVWTAIWLLTKRKQLFRHRIEDIDVFIVLTTIVFGTIHALVLGVSLIEFSNGIVINQSLGERAFGKYWYGFWMYPAAYFVLTQLLWSSRIRRTKVIRAIIAALIFTTMHIEILVIFVTSLHRDYLPGDSDKFPIYILRQVGLTWLIGLLIFGAFVIIGLKLKNTATLTWRRSK